LWFLVSALGFWAMIVIRHALMSGMAVFYVGDSMPRAWRARFYDRAYFVIAGLIYLIFIFAIEGYLWDGVPLRDLFRRFARLAGIEGLILFVADLFTSIIQKTLLGRVSIILAVVELVLGGGLLAYSIIKKPKRHPRVFSQAEPPGS
jgi:hypothetical protein